MKHETCVEKCRLCSGELCAVCGVRDERCKHDPVERHGCLPIEIEPGRRGLPTEPLTKSLLAGKITIDLSDADAVAEFLELTARVARSRQRLTIIVE